MSASGVSIIGESITIEEPDINMILAYGISDEKGNLRLVLKQTYQVYPKIKAYEIISYSPCIYLLLNQWYI